MDERVGWRRERCQMLDGVDSCDKRQAGDDGRASVNDDRTALIPAEKEAGGTEMDVEGSGEAP